MRPMRLFERLGSGKPETGPPVQEPKALAQAPVLESVLAAKVLASHMANRNQLMAVDPTNLMDLEADDAVFLIRAMGAAAHSDGGLDPQEQSRIRAALVTTPLDQPSREKLEGELQDPPCLERLARKVGDLTTATRFYAVSVATLQRGAETNRAYLDYLAHRLALPTDVVVRLNRRFEVPL